MGMAAALWDALSKAANLAQMSGLHAVMLVAVVASLLRVPQSKRECAKLQRCSRRLCVLLQWPTGCGAVLLQSEMGGPAVKALVDAAGLVDDYKKSTLWRRVRWGRSMATRFCYNGRLVISRARFMGWMIHRKVEAYKQSAIAPKLQQLVTLK